MKTPGDSAAPFYHSFFSLCCHSALQLWGFL
jgi:hypothetical protein